MKRKLSNLVVASHNAGKVSEIRDLLLPFGVTTTSAKDLGLADIEETGDSFAQNAGLKAMAAADASRRPALADDSGLAVDALGGAPGIHSARYAEDENGQRDFARAMEKLHTEMQDKGGADTARFVCALALAFPDGEVHVYEGKVEGRITWPPRGEKGFGYDPVFVAEGDKLTFGELDPSEKHAKSHRADAFGKFIKDWFDDECAR